MNRRSWKLIFVGIALVGAILACNYPGAEAPTPFVFTTPDRTLTAQATANLPFPTPKLQTATQPAAQEATATLAPTAQGQKTPQATNPPQGNNQVRTAAQATAVYLSTPPNIDGDLGEWKLTAYPAKNVVFGPEYWSNEADLSATYMVGWNENNLYIAAHVLDDTYVQGATKGDIYKGDSLEILFDSNLGADFYVNALSPDDFQIGISPGKDQPGTNPEAYVWFPSNIAGSRSEIKIGAKGTSGGYDVEAAIPWSTLETTPQAGKHYGFAFSVSDNDKPGQNIQQSMVSSVPDRHLVDPTSWGDLLLQK